MTEIDPIALLSEQFAAVKAENATMREELDEVTMMFRAEDRGWSLIAGLTTGERLEGLDLDELKEISEAIRPHVVGDSLAKRGVDLQSGYVWGKGMNVDGARREPGKRGAPTDLQKLVSNPVNQDSIFSSLAYQELQKARYTDGNVYLVCNTRDNTIRRIPLNQISGIKVNPEYPEEVWAYQRTWDPDPSNVKSQEKKAWYYTARFPKRRQASYTVGGVTVPVMENETMVDVRFNRQVGYPLGIPDAVAAMPWIAAYDEIMQYGRVVNESLAKILFKVISKTKNGANSAAVKIAGMKGAGNTASMLEGQDLQAINSAGKGYDFISAQRVASQAAAALNVPTIELLSDSSAAGSSYGAAQSLSPSTKNAMRLMQTGWVEMYQSILDVFKIPVPRIWFDPLDDVDIYRAMQAITLGSGVISDEEYRGKVLDTLDIAGDPAKIPDILKFRTAAADPAVQQAAPDQGQNNGTGGGGQGSNDQRTDSVGEMMRRVQDDAFLDRFEELVNRFESLKD